MPEPWEYTRKKAGYFSIPGDKLGEDEYPFGIVLLSSINGGKILEEYGDKLRHGDIIDFGSYRGCGYYIVEPVDVNKSDFYIWKSMEEMGYGLPPNFSDAPDGYYSKSELFYIFKHIDFVHPVHWLWEEVKTVKENPDDPDVIGNTRNVFRWNEEIKMENFPEDYLYFEDNLNGGISWLSKEAFAYQDYYDPKNWDFWKERFEMRNKSKAKSARSVIQLESSTKSEEVDENTEEEELPIHGKRDTSPIKLLQLQRRRVTKK